MSPSDNADVDRPSLPRSELNDAKIMASWDKNALPWIAAVREGQIESRRQITHQAILDAVMSGSPRSVLDLGCGEGWLARELAVRNVPVWGVDAAPMLVEAAQQAGGGDFRVMSYAEIIAGKLEILVDAVVCNFALFGNESVEALLSVIPALLQPYGRFIVQTLHPILACGDLPYRDGWREGSWSGFSSDFTEPAPWYFRTLESWIALFVNHGFRLLELREPRSPPTQQPASVIFITKPERPADGDPSAQATL